MRSKQRRTHRHNQQQIAQALTPNPHLKYKHSRDRGQDSHSQSKMFRLSHPAEQSKENASKIDVLIRQNNELRKEIIELKVHQFYHFDDEKLKQLLKQLEMLRKEVKKYKQIAHNMQIQNDFLTRKNTQLRNQLEKEIAVRTKDSYAQDLSKCTLKYSNHRVIDDEITHLSSTSGINILQNTTIDDPFDHYKPEHSKNQNKLSRKNLIEKCLSPRRCKQSGRNQSPNQYLLYRRNKEKNQNILEG